MAGAGCEVDDGGVTPVRSSYLSHWESTGRLQRPFSRKRRSKASAMAKRRVRGFGPSLGRNPSPARKMLATSPYGRGEENYFESPPRLSRNTPCSPNMFQNHQGKFRRSGRP